MTLSIPQILIKQGLTFSKQFISSKDLGFKLARIGVGSTLVGAGVGTGLTLASSGVNEVAEKTSDVFGIPREILFILGALGIFLLLMGMK